MSQSEHSLDGRSEYPLADLVTALVDQLSESHRRGVAKESDFALEGASVELGLTWTHDVNGKLEFKVFGVGVGGGGDVSRERATTMTVKLVPAHKKDDYLMAEPPGDGSVLLGE